MRIWRFWPCLFLGLVLIAIFYPALFFGAVLGGHHDRFDQMLPFYALYSRAFQAGVVPQWNPYVFCGKTTMGSGMFIFFYPLYWLAFAAPEARLAATTTFILIVHVAIALFGAFCLFRRLGADRFWATVATASYVFSASMALQIATELNFATFAYLPVLLWLVVRQRPRFSAWNFAAQATIYALILLSGMVQLVLYGVAVSLAFAAYRATLRSRRPLRLDVRRLSASVAAFGLGLAIAAVRWIPFFAAQGSEGGPHPSYEAFESTSHMALTDLVRFAMPEFFGTDGYESFFGQINHFESFGGSAGVLGGWVMLCSIFGPWRRRTAFWNFLFVVILLTVLGTPLTHLHYLATGRSLLHYSRVAWLIPLPCAALIAVNGRRIFASVTKWTFASMAAFGIASLGLAVAAYRTRLPDYAKILLHDTIRDSVGQFVVVLVVIGLLAALAHRIGETARAFRVALLTLVTIDLLTIFGAEANISNPFMVQSSSLTFPEVDREAAALVRAPRMFRVLRPPRKRLTRSWANFTVNDRWIVLGAYSSSGYDNGAPHDIVDLYTYHHPPNRIFERVVMPSTPHVAELVSTRFYTDDLGLHELGNAAPRVQLFTRYQVADDTAASEAILDPSFDSKSKLIVHETPRFSSDERPVVGSVEIVRDEINEVELSARTDRSALLLLNDTYDAGWRAEVDGLPARAVRANYAFRAVEVPPGQHTVRWTYRQRGYPAARAISIMGTFALLALAAYATLQAYRRRAK
jgi:hypothetical protein